MPDPTYSWLTAHRARFPSALSPKTSRFDAPRGAAAWRYGPDAPLAANGLPTSEAEIWGGVGFFNSRAEAETALDGPLPFADQAEESWHGLLAVIAHRGEVDWSTADEPHPGLTPVAEDPGGPMVVITSAGFEWMDETRLPALKDFLKRVSEVVLHYREREGNLAVQLFNGNGSPEGMTFSVWAADASMFSAAYREGTHPDNLSAHKAQPMFDRSSFTRMRLLRDFGVWSGSGLPVTA